MADKKKGKTKGEKKSTKMAISKSSESKDKRKRGSVLKDYLSTMFFSWVAFIVFWAILLGLEARRIFSPFMGPLSGVDLTAFVGFILIIDFFRVGLLTAILAAALKFVLDKAGMVPVRKRLHSMIFPSIGSTIVMLVILALRTSFLNNVGKLILVVAYPLLAATLIFMLANPLWRNIRGKTLLKVGGGLLVLLLALSGVTLAAHAAMDIYSVRQFVSTLSIRRPDSFDLRDSNVLRVAVESSPILLSRVKILLSLADPDGDGFHGPWLMGGNDCNNFDSSINPLAFDINNNGIDEDCYNGDYTVQIEEREFSLSEIERPINPDIVVFYIDGLRVDKLGVNGYPRNTTPTLDRLAREGVNFETVVTHGTQSIPILTSVLSGASVTEHRVLTNSQDSNEDLISLYSVFQDNGYHTMYVDDAALMEELHVLREEIIDSKVVNPFPQDQMAPPFTEWTTEALEDVPEDSPLFAIFHFSGVHQPFVNLPEYLKLVDPNPSQVLRLSEQTSLSPELIQRIESTNYIVDGEIRRVDSLVAELIPMMRSRSGNGGTLFMVISDQGESWGENQVRWADHGTTHFEEEIMVPLIFSPAELLPGVVAGSSVENQVRLIDVFPTLVDLLGFKLGNEISSQVSGMSLVPLMYHTLDGESPGPATIYHSTGDYKTFEDSVVLSLRRPDNIKLIFIVSENRKEMYNLTSDPDERENLYFSYPQLAEEMENQLMQIYQEDYHRFYKNYGGEVRERDLTDRERQALIELGYLTE